MPSLKARSFLSVIEIDGPFAGAVVFRDQVERIPGGSLPLTAGRVYVLSMHPGMPVAKMTCFFRINHGYPNQGGGDTRTALGAKWNPLH
jgi:hypothetical protein